MSTRPSYIEPNRPKRPASVTWLAAAVLCLAGINAASAGETMVEWDLWSQFALPFPLLLRVALSAVWAIALAAAAWGLWTLRRWARRGTLALFPLYALYDIGWRLAFVRGDYERGRLPFVLGMAVAATLVVVWILTRKQSRWVFESGRKSSDGGSE